MDPQTMMMLMNMMGGGGQGGGGFNPMSGLMQMFSGMTANSGKPYDKAMDQYSKYFNQGIDTQKPYNEAGLNALTNQQDLLKKMSDPSGFINDLMGKYQESAGAKYQQQQGMRTANNIGSASGLSGSTPLMQQAQQNSQGIASGDMQNWLANALGVNKDVMSGYNDIRKGGQDAADTMSKLFGQSASDMANMQYGKTRNEQNDRSNFWGGLGKFMGWG